MYVFSTISTLSQSDAYHSQLLTFVYRRVHTIIFYDKSCNQTELELQALKQIEVIEVTLHFPIIFIM